MRKMKDSGLSWLDTIPEHWKVDKFKSKFSFGKGLNITKENLTTTGTKVISYGQIHSKANKTTFIDDSLYRFVSNDYVESVPSALVSKGDIIFADTSEDYAGIGNCVHVDIDDEDVFAGYHTVIAHPEKSENSKYLSYLFLTDCWRSQIRSSVSGIKVFSITQKILKQLSIILPPVDEQNKITAFLDNKCAKLDDIISKQQEVIEKLNTYKLSVIAESVTKGLISDRKVKDSCCEFIGQVPAGWQVMKFGRCVAIKSNLVSPEDYAEYPQISPEHIEKNSGKLLDTYTTVKESGVISGNHLFFEGQIIYSKIRPMLNKVTIAPFDGLCSADMYPIETDNHTKFILYMMLSDYFTAQVGLVTENRVKMPKINQNELSNITVALPPMDEQKEIADYLDKKCAAIDSSIAKRQQLIDKLTEYKKSLIFEVVTGKKEV